MALNLSSSMNDWTWYPPFNFISFNYIRLISAWLSRIRKIRTLLLSSVAQTQRCKMRTMGNILLIFTILKALIEVTGQQHDCDGFTFSDCNIEDNLVWENDVMILDHKIKWTINNTFIGWQSRALSECLLCICNMWIFLLWQWNM